MRLFYQFLVIVEFVIYEEYPSTIAKRVKTECIPIHTSYDRLT